LSLISTTRVLSTRAWSWAEQLKPRAAQDAGESNTTTNSAWTVLATAETSPVLGASQIGVAERAYLPEAPASCHRLKFRPPVSPSCTTITTHHMAPRPYGRKPTEVQS
jgi:hypothetical protein